MLRQKDREAAYSVLPGGNKATLTLSDGRIVTLDSLAGNTITEQNGVRIINPVNGRLSYTAFTGTTREVTIAGEVYMEVAADKTKPFLVKARGMTVEVLGTYFNINAYTDEPAIFLNRLLFTG